MTSGHGSGAGHERVTMIYCPADAPLSSVVLRLS